jgi:hypothetical protein
VGSPSKPVWKEVDVDSKKKTDHFQTKFNQYSGSISHDAQLPTRQSVAQSKVTKGGQIRSNNNKKDNKIENKWEKNEGGDLLDVGFMERSLDRRYNSNSNLGQKTQMERQRESDNEFDVKKLEENLARFEETRAKQN